MNTAKPTRALCKRKRKRKRKREPFRHPLKPGSFSSNSSHLDLADSKLRISPKEIGHQAGSHLFHHIASATSANHHELLFLPNRSRASDLSKKSRRMPQRQWIAS